MSLTQDEIIRMAREAGLLAYDGEVWLSPYQEAMERFAALVAAHEREACAEVYQKIFNDTADKGAVKCALAIRARGEK